MSNIEREIKILNVDAKRVMLKMKELGVKPKGKYIQDIYTFNFPTVNDDFRYEYTFNKETIKAELYEISMIDEAIDETLVDTKIYDLSNVEADKEYTSLPEFIVEINRDEDNNLEVEVVNYVSSSETDEEALFPEWVETEDEEFIVPEGIEVNYLEEIVVSEPEENIIEKLEGDNRALTLRVEELKKQMESDKKANEAMTLEILDLMMGLL